MSAFAPGPFPVSGGSSSRFAQTGAGARDGASAAVRRIASNR
jgi:hypothetical protein